MVIADEGLRCGCCSRLTREGNWNLCQT